MCCHGLRSLGWCLRLWLEHALIRDLYSGDGLNIPLILGTIRREALQPSSDTRCIVLCPSC